MSSLCHSAAAAGPKAAGPTPQLSNGNTTMRYYRRSTTTKAPRKRTFLLTMEKFEARLVSQSSISCLGINKVAMLNFNDRCCDEFIGGGDAGNNNRGGNKKRGGDNGDNSDGFFANGPARLQPLLTQALLGALALTLAVAAFPASSQASQSAPLPRLLLSEGRTSTGSSPSRPRSKVMHVACKGSTLVVPLPASGVDAKEASTRAGQQWQGRGGKVVEAPIVLSEREVAIMSESQYRVRESMRV